MSKWVGNMACVLAYIFNSASRQHHEVQASQFLLHSIKDLVPLSEACLYVYINWSQAQAHHQTSLGNKQSSTCMRGARANPRAGFCFNVW